MTTFEPGKTYGPATVLARKGRKVKVAAGGKTATAKVWFASRTAFGPATEFLMLGPATVYAA
jgi:hypothetical protein